MVMGHSSGKQRYSDSPKVTRSELKGENFSSKIEQNSSSATAKVSVLTVPQPSAPQDSL